MSTRTRWLLAAAISVAAVVLVNLSTIGTIGRAGLVATVCLSLWLLQLVPVWVPTLVLWVATPALLWNLDSKFAPLEVLAWSIDPVLALFLGGFALAAAARVHGVDRMIAARALSLSGQSSTRLLAAAAAATAVLSMWMSNVAAAALMLNAFRPIWSAEPAGSALRRALLLVIALAADVGGIATPIGTGANGIALAAVEHTRNISFLHWMAFGVPLAGGLVVASVLLIVLRLRPSAPAPLEVAVLHEPAVASLPLAERTSIKSASTRTSATPARATTSRKRLGVIFALTVVLWLGEPLHGIPSWMVAIGAVVLLLGLRVLPWREFVRIDWGTLFLVAGGIALGALLDRSGLVNAASSRLPLHQFPEFARLFVLCVVSATMAAFMSNTGTAALLIPLAASIDPSPSTAIIVAVAASLGVPFVISTPPNAMASAGGLRSTDLIVPGLILMLGGCLLIAVTGPFVLSLVGVP